MIVIVCAVCFGRWGQENSDFSFQFDKTVYTYKDEYCSVEDLVYLQMVGSRNKEKERKINQLLEDDRKKVLELAIPDPDEELPFHLLYVLRKIKIWFTVDVETLKFIICGDVLIMEKNGSYFKLERVGQVQMSDGFEG